MNSYRTLHLCFLALAICWQTPTAASLSPSAYAADSDDLINELDRPGESLFGRCPLLSRKDEQEVEARETAISYFVDN